MIGPGSDKKWLVILERCWSLHDYWLDLNREWTYMPLYMKLQSLKKKRYLNSNSQIWKEKSIFILYANQNSYWSTSQKHRFRVGYIFMKGVFYLICSTPNHKTKKLSKIALAIRELPLTHPSQFVYLGHPEMLCNI